MELTVNDQLNQIDLFRAFKAQLAKDFEQSNFPSEFVDQLPANYEVIHQQLLKELERNEKRSSAAIMQLLYRVDISEAQLKRYLQEKNDKNHLSVIAELIIKRVLQKVVTREVYKRR